MGFITKLKSAFGGEKASENVSIADTTEAIMKDIEHDAFAVSDSNVLYAGLNFLRMGTAGLTANSFGSQDSSPHS